MEKLNALFKQYDDNLQRSVSRETFSIAKSNIPSLLLISDCLGRGLELELYNFFNGFFCHVLL